MELMVVVAIIVVLAGVAVPLYMGRLEDAKKDTTKAQVKIIAQQCDLYKLKNGDFPASLEVLVVQQPDGSLPYLQPGDLLDPWGHEFQYAPFGQHNAQYGKVDVWSLGPTPDGAHMIGNWSARFQCQDSTAGS